MPCQWLNKQYGSCDRPGYEKVCGEWSKWYWDELQKGDKPDTFCIDEKYKERWDK